MTKRKYLDDTKPRVNYTERSDNTAQIGRQQIVAAKSTRMPRKSYYFTQGRTTPKVGGYRTEVGSKERYKQLAKHYISQAPSAKNLYNAASNYLMSIGADAGEGTGVQGGTVLTPNGPGNAAKLAQEAKALNNVVKNINAARRTANSARSVSSASDAVNAARQTVQDINRAGITSGRRYEIPTVTKKLRYRAPLVSDNPKVRRNVFDDFVNGGDENKVIKLVAREQHIPERLVQHYIIDSGGGSRASIANALGRYGRNNINPIFEDKIADYFNRVLNLDPTSDFTIANTFNNYGLSPMDRAKVARHMRHDGALDKTLLRLVNKRLEDPYEVMTARDQIKALSHSRGGQEFLRKYNLNPYQLSDLMNVGGFGFKARRAANFSSLGNELDAYLNNLGTTSDISTLLNNRRLLVSSPSGLSSMAPGSISNGDLNFYMLEAQRLHPDLTRGIPKRTMMKRISDRVDQALKPENQYRIREKLDGSYSASSAPMIINASTKLAKRRNALGLYHGRILPNYLGSSLTRLHGNDFGNVNLGTYNNPRIGDVFGQTPTLDEIRSYPNRQEAVNLINLKLANLYKTFQELEPSAYSFDPAMLDAVIANMGDVEAAGAANGMWSNGKTPLWARFLESEDAPEYPNIFIDFANGGSVAIPSKRKKRYK